MCESCKIFPKLYNGSAHSGIYLCSCNYLHTCPAGNGKPLIHKIMGSLLYIIAVILVIAWAVGFFAYSAGGIIHILLVIALIAIIFRVIQGRSAI